MENLGRSPFKQSLPDMMVCTCFEAFGLWPGSSKGPHETLPPWELLHLLWGGSAPHVRHHKTHKNKMVLSLQAYLLIGVAIITQMCQKSLMHITIRLPCTRLIIKPSLSCDGNPALWVEAEENNKFGFETLDAVRSQALSFPSMALLEAEASAQRRGTR